MNKADFIKAVALESGVTKDVAETVYKGIIDSISTTLKSGEEVRLAGFGTFKITERAARMGHNPKTKEPLKIEASKTPSFKSMKAFKEIFKK